MPDPVTFWFENESPQYYHDGDVTPSVSWSEDRDMKVGIFMVSHATNHSSDIAYLLQCEVFPFGAFRCFFPVLNKAQHTKGIPKIMYVCFSHSL